MGTPEKIHLLLGKTPLRATLRPHPPMQGKKPSVEAMIFPFSGPSAIPLKRSQGLMCVFLMGGWGWVLGLEFRVLV